MAFGDTTGKIYRPSIRYISTNSSQSQLYIETQPSLTSTSITEVVVSYWEAMAFSGTPFWLRLQLTGGNFVFFNLTRCLSWNQYDSRAASIIGTFSNVGFSFIDTANGQPCYISIFSWTLTTP
jgi:hypothetical protein